MQFQVIIREQAVKDAQDAYDWYEDQVPGLGERFLQELGMAYVKLGHSPRNYGFADGQDVLVFRDYRLPSFPYLVVFEVMDLRVIVHAVFHARMAPEKRWPQ